MNKNTEKWFWNAIKVLVLIGLAYIIFFQISLPKLIDAIKRTNLFWLGAAVFMYFLVTVLISYRFKKGLEFLKNKIGYTQLYLSNMFGMLCSDVTPGRFGYAAVVYDLNKRAKIKIADGLAVLGIVGATDMLAKGICALIGLLFLVFVFNSSIFIQTALVSVAIIILVSCVFLVIVWFDIKHFDKLIKSMPIIGNWVFKFINEFRRSGKALKKKFIFFMALTPIFWLIRGLEWYFIGKATGANLPFLTLFMLHPLLTAIRYVPVTPAGIGLFEEIMILGLGIFGVAPENALLFAFFDRVDNIFVDVIGAFGFRRD